MSQDPVALDLQSHAENKEELMRFPKFYLYV